MAETEAPETEALAPVAIEDLPAVVDAVARKAARVVDHYEVRAEEKRHRKYVLENGALAAAGLSRLGGVSVKVHVGGATGFASTHDTDSDAALARLVERAVRIARANAARGGDDFPFVPGHGRRVAYAPDVKRHPRDGTLQEFTDLVRRAHEGAAAEDPGSRVASAFGAMDRRILVADSSGAWIDHDYLLSTVFVQVVHRGGPRLADGAEWASGERGLTDFEDDGGPEAVGRAAAAYAKEAAVADACPAGRLRILCDNNLTGLLAHESFGHLTEYDLVSMGWSILAGRKGQRFAGEHVSIVDAPEVPGAPRTGVRVPFDEEGTPGRDVRILDRGVLERYMHLRGTAGAEEDSPAGNARALSVRHAPIVRMRNTFIEPGDLSVEEALETVGDGVYLIGGRGGAPASDGSFMFTAQRGYRVKGGKIEAPVRSTSISGNVLDFLSGIEGVTRDFKVFSTYFGGCGKWDQGLLHVGMGGPHTIVTGALVGGEAA